MFSFPGGTVVKIHLQVQEMQQTWVQSLGQADPLEKGMATHSSILTWKNSMDRGTWGTAVYRVAKSRAQLSNWAHMHVCVCQEHSKIQLSDETAEKLSCKLENENKKNKN